MKQLLLVLHAHLPWGHLSDEDDAAAQWLLEACVDCYQPLLTALERLDAEGVPFRLTLSVSPPLAAMWSSPKLNDRLAAYVAAEQQAWRSAPAEYAKAADFHLARLAEPRRDLDAGFRALKQVERITSTATHGFLPLLKTVPAAARAQVSAAGPTPGMWLAECGYTAGADGWLRDAGVGYFFVDSHAVSHAAHAHRRPVQTTRGVFAFARDPQASAQVWSAKTGYPGDPAYLDFHHRVGGRRVLRVPGEGAWDPAVARDRAQIHARHFVAERAANGGDVITAPYDAELFGHWWFEGPDFLEAVVRAVAESQAVQLNVPSRLCAPDAERVELPETSWGRGGHSAVWLDAANAWMWPHLHRAAEAMVALADRSDRVAKQAARELLLAQASDWPFLIEAMTNAGYATKRFEDHLLAFQKLAGGDVDEAYLSKREAANNLFGAIDPRVYGRGDDRPEAKPKESAEGRREEREKWPR